MRSSSVGFLSVIFISFVNIANSSNKTDGVASWYGGKKYENKITAYGYKFHSSDLTCATLNYSQDVFLKVTNRDNDKYVIVKVIDKNSPNGNLVDLSMGAFSRIANLQQGVARVEIEEISK